MYKQTTKLYLLILLIFITACVSRNSNDYSSKFGDINKDSILNSLQDKIKFSQTPLYEITIPAHSKLSKLPNQLLDNWETAIDTIIVIPLDNQSKEGLMMDVNKIVIKDSIIYILDKDKAKKLYAFNRNTGKFIRTFGDVGRAENEYVSPHDFFIVNDRLIGIYDHFGRKILYYDRDGSYLRTTRLKYIAMNMVNNPGDTTLWCVGHGNYHLSEVNNFDLLKIGLNGKIYNGVSHGNGYLNYASLTNLKPYKEGIIYHHPFTNTLFHIKDSVYYKLVEAKFEEKGLPDDFISQCNGDMVNFFDLYEKTHSYAEDFIIIDDYILIRYTSEPRMPYLLIYSIKDKRIIAQGMFSVDGSAKIKPELQHYILASMINITGEGNTIWGLVNLIGLDHIQDDEGFKKYNIDKNKLMDENYFLVMVKMK